MATTTLKQARSLSRLHARLGRRAEIVASIVLLALVLFFAARALLAGAYSPEAAVRAYVGALQRGDADGAYANSKVVNGGSADASLTDKRALEAMLGNGNNGRTFDSFAISGSTTSGNTAAVYESYSAGSATRTGTFLVQQDPSRNQLGLIPVWSVQVRPAVLALSLPQGAGQLTVDGLRVDVAQGKSQTVAVWPGVHVVRVGGSTLFQPSSTVAHAELQATTSRVDFAYQLTPAGLTSARSAITAAMAACVASSSPQPDKCPQSLSSTFSPGAVQWKLVGDPTTGLTFATDQKAQFTALGHYAMVGAVQSFGSATHSASAGGYVAVLATGPAGFNVSQLSSSDQVPALPRPPAASDAAALASVRSGLQDCAASKSATPTDCPQMIQPSTANVANVKWQLNGDPMAGAQVTYDGSRGIFHVSGSFSMGVSYDIHELVTSHWQDTDSGRYLANLLWDGQQFRLVNISRDFGG